MDVTTPEQVGHYKFSFFLHINYNPLDVTRPVSPKRLVLVQ